MRNPTSKSKKKEIDQSLCLTLPAVVAEDLYSLVHSVGIRFGTLDRRIRALQAEQARTDEYLQSAAYGILDEAFSGRL